MPNKGFQQGHEKAAFPSETFCKIYVREPAAVPVHFDWNGCFIFCLDLTKGKHAFNAAHLFYVSVNFVGN